MNRKSIIFNLEELPQVIPIIWESIKNEKIILLQGEMGAGKTTLIAFLAQYLNIDGDVQSPTYALMNEYHYINENGDHETWIHSDWFRIEDEGEALDAGFEELLYDANTKHFIEWHEKILSLIPKNSLILSLEKIDATTRRLTFNNL